MDGLKHTSLSHARKVAQKSAASVSARVLSSRHKTCPSASACKFPDDNFGVHPKVNAKRMLEWFKSCDKEHKAAAAEQAVVTSFVHCIGSMQSSCLH